MLIAPMPSPRGTNRTRLFILSGRADPRAAFDSANGLENARGSETMAQLLAWAEENLSPEEMHALAEELMRVVERSPAEGEQGARQPAPPQATRPRHSGQPAPARPAQDRFDPRAYGRALADKILAQDRAARHADHAADRIAQDAAAFYARHPDAQRITAEAPPRHEPAPVASPEAQRGFFERFPDAARIKLG